MSYNPTLNAHTKVNPFWFSSDLGGLVLFLSFLITQIYHHHMNGSDLSIDRSTDERSLLRYIYLAWFCLYQSPSMGSLTTLYICKPLNLSTMHYLRHPHLPCLTEIPVELLIVIHVYLQETFKSPSIACTTCIPVSKS